jgi:peroxiredoxin
LQRFKDTSVRLALVGLGALLLTGGGLAVLARSAPETPPASPGPLRAPSEGPRTTAPPGRRVDLERAMRDLDLFRPPRPRAVEDFALPTPDGRTFRLADHRGRLVFINFWATWCEPCRQEMPAMERLWRRHRHRAFTMVGVSLDSDPAAVAPFVREHGLTFPIALDSRLTTANAYGVRALPTTVLLGRDGTVAALALGPRAWDNDAAHSLVEALASQ